MQVGGRSTPAKSGLEEKFQDIKQLVTDIGRETRLSLANSDLVSSRADQSFKDGSRIGAGVLSTKPRHADSSAENQNIPLHHLATIERRHPALIPRSSAIWKKSNVHVFCSWITTFHQLQVVLGRSRLVTNSLHIVRSQSCRRDPYAQRIFVLLGLQPSSS